jgi:hypothetical protein
MIDLGYGAVAPMPADGAMPAGAPMPADGATPTDRPTPADGATAAGAAGAIPNPLLPIPGMPGKLLPTPGVAVTEGRPIAGALDATGTGVATPAVGGNCGSTGFVGPVGVAAGPAPVLRPYPNVPTLVRPVGAPADPAEELTP